MKVLMVLTSHNRLGDTGCKTGFWLKVAAPYFVFRDAGVELTLVSPKGGQPPVDPESDLQENQTPALTRFKRDTAAEKELSQIVTLPDMKSEVTGLNPASSTAAAKALTELLAVRKAA